MVMWRHRVVVPYTCTVYVNLLTEGRKVYFHILKIRMILDLKAFQAIFRV